MFVRAEGTPRLAASLSITYKGAIPLPPRPRDGRMLAANASLFTVLVTDTPVERLKLRQVSFFFP